MAGTSPFSCNTPSYHSSSYLPKLEANFMRDFACCDVNLASLHDLVKHYETVHGHPYPAALSQSRSSASHAPNSRMDHGGGGVGIALMGPPEAHSLSMNRGAYGTGGVSLPVFSPPTPSHATIGSSRDSWRGRNRGFSKTSLPPVPDFDVVDDMEMDDAMPLDAVDDGGASSVLDLMAGQTRSLASASASASSGMFPESRGPGRPPLPPLDLVSADFGQGASMYPDLHASQPTTPLASARLMRPLQNNPTVSSVNTPTLSTQTSASSSSSQQQQQQQQQQHYQQQGTPIIPLSTAVDDSFGQTSTGMPTPVSGVPHFGFGNAIGTGASGMCIDHPARRLFGHDGDVGGSLGQRTPERTSSQRSRQRKTAKANRQDGETAGSNTKRSKAQASAANGDEECRPFRCPVVGCEKAYKNQNGLKYHRTVSARFDSSFQSFRLYFLPVCISNILQHGHSTQQLSENSDGTISILNPETSIPYPGTLGMEKEKPYGCTRCGKRYKNLNGLKYHKAHSQICNTGGKTGASPSSTPSSPKIGGSSKTAGNILGAGGSNSMPASPAPSTGTNTPTQFSAATVTAPSSRPPSNPRSNMQSNLQANMNMQSFDPTAFGGVATVGANAGARPDDAPADNDVDHDTAMSMGCLSVDVGPGAPSMNMGVGTDMRTGMNMNMNVNVNMYPGAVAVPHPGTGVMMQ